MDFAISNAEVRDKNTILALKQEHMDMYGYHDVIGWKDSFTDWDISHANIAFFYVIKLGFDIIGFIHLNSSDWNLPFYEIYLPLEYVDEDTYSSIIKCLLDDIADGEHIVRIGCYKCDDDSIFVCEELGGKEMCETETHLAFEFHLDFPVDSPLDLSKFDELLCMEDKGKWCMYIPR